MPSNNDPRLFTVAEVSKACDISRTSLIRLEESGFFRPYHIDPNTGYRYYDINNVVEIGRYKRFRNIGLTRDEITGFFHDTVDRDAFLALQIKKLGEMQDFVNELELLQGRDHYCYAFSTIPAQTCYCEDFEPPSYAEAFILTHQIYEKVLAEGYRVAPEYPPFIISDEWQNVTEKSPSGARFTLCINVLPSAGRTKDPHLRYFPETPAISVSGFGDFTLTPKVLSKLHMQLSERKFEENGPLRFIGLATDADSRGGYIIKFIQPVNAV